MGIGRGNKFWASSGPDHQGSGGKASPNLFVREERSIASAIATVVYRFEQRNRKDIVALWKRTAVWRREVAILTRGRFLRALRGKLIRQTAQGVISGARERGEDLPNVV